MKNFKTITEMQILQFAYFGLLEQIEHEKEINERTILESGHENSIALLHIKRKYEQFEEIRTRIIFIEKGLQD